MHSGRVTKCLSLLLSLALASGCQIAGHGPSRRYCDLTSTIWAHPADVLTDRTASQIERHNITRERICK